MALEKLGKLTLKLFWKESKDPEEKKRISLDGKTYFKATMSQTVWSGIRGEAMTKAQFLKVNLMMQHEKAKV